MSKVAISLGISLSHFALPGDDKGKGPRSSLVGKRLIPDFFVKLRGAIVCREQQAEMLFSADIFGTAQSLSTNDTTRYQKSFTRFLRLTLVFM